MNRPRRIAVVSGKRGGFGAMLPMMRIIEDDPGLELQLILTDQHLRPDFGQTVIEVERFLPVAVKVPLNQVDDSGLERVVALGTGLTGMGRTLKELGPDVLCLYGDRGESVAAAVAALHLGVPIAHLQGGDVTGGLDDLFRHALTKMSHLHFASCRESADRILQMGEEPWRVHVVGDSHIDPLVAGVGTPQDEVAARYDLDPDRPLALVLQHSVSTEPERAYDQMTATLSALDGFDLRLIVVYPCTDPGFQGILRAIDEHRRQPGMSVHPNIDCFDFYTLMRLARVMVGNSSAGIIEAPYVGLPVVNVGGRQTGRLCAENVCHVADGDVAGIKEGVSRALTDDEFRRRAGQCSRPYGDGRAGERVVEVLRTIELGPALWYKKMVDRPSPRGQ